MSIWTPPRITALTDAQSTADAALFSLLNIPIVSAPEDGSWTLKRVSGALILQSPEGLTQHVDFVGGKTRHRSQEAGHGAAPLKKALGISTFEKRHGCKPRVVDATGGWGQDAWLMASLDCQVDLIEQHAIVHALLADALHRAHICENGSEVAQRIRLHKGDASHVLNQFATDVIYLDPMYPHRVRKKADSKKGMQILQALLGPADESQSAKLLDSALNHQAARVVVKRPKVAAVLEPSQPFAGQLIEIHSPNTRYDIYLSHTT